MLNDNDPDAAMRAHVHARVEEAVRYLAEVGRAKAAAVRPLKPRTPARLNGAQLAMLRASMLRKPRPVP